MVEIGRRNFLRFGLALAVGVSVGRVKPYVGTEINRNVNEITGYPVGNANYRTGIEKSCSDKPDLQECIKSFQPTIVDKLTGVIVTPIQEEIQYRALPSVWFMKDEIPMETILYGKGSLRMNRRELAVGTFTSLLFGALHNITDNPIGIDINTFRHPKQ